MSTISAMSRNNYTMLKYAQEKGVSLFDGSATNLSTDYGYSSSSKKTNSTSSGMWSNSSIWDTYNSSNVSSAASTAEGLVGIRSSLAEMTSSYKNAASTFKTEHKSTMSDLKDASSAIKNMDFNVGGEDAVTKTENADGTTTVTKSTKLKDALKSIENFVDKYNDAIEFFDDNADVSNRIKNMGKTFADTTYNSDLLSSIGVNVGKDGTMKIDEDKLTDALTSDPNKVSRILGKDGLAGKADNHVSFANSQADRLFPSLSSSLGSAISQSSVYTGRSLLQLSQLSAVGNILNMWA